MTEVWIDPNVRVRGGQTFSGFEDIKGPMPQVGNRVLVREPESNLVGIGVVTRINDTDRIIYISVNWAELAPDRLPTPDELMQTLRASYAAPPAVDRSEQPVTV
ncbi:MAG: hypothetical protein ACLP75_25440 [Mycobacterium sp.]|uniref:hypothetical protein n=1 Tax=Mycobacterium sp. TaxID=1785 RepID=UPI003F97A573